MNPLADRLRPTTFDDMVGQAHLLGRNGALRKIVSAGFLPNMIFFGPPGTGKTTAANIIAAASDKTLCRLNATTASLSDIREVTQQTTGLFGAGGVHYDTYIPALHYAGFDGFLTIERECGETPEKDIGMAVDFLRSMTERYGYYHK